MTLDEAIRHAEKIASESCDRCAEEHKQLATWLRRLKTLEETEEKRHSQHQKK